eukprot:scaffold66400_cov69-Phaeocystis_antarctica.AAC.3
MRGHVGGRRLRGGERAHGDARLAKAALEVRDGCSVRVVGVAHVRGARPRLASRQQLPRRALAQPAARELVAPTRRLWQQEHAACLERCRPPAFAVHASAQQRACGCRSAQNCGAPKHESASERVGGLFRSVVMKRQA